MGGGTGADARDPAGPVPGAPVKRDAQRRVQASAAKMLAAAKGLLRRAKACPTCPRYQRLQIAAAVARLALLAAAERAQAHRPARAVYRDPEEADEW